MKRAGGFSAGGWFIPGGHVEQGERPAESAAREVFEEAGITLNPAELALVDVMTYDAGGATAHTLIYNGACAETTEASINEEHSYHRWMTPEGYIARFLDEAMLRGRGAGEGAIALANEVARCVRSAVAARSGNEQ